MPPLPRAGPWNGLPVTPERVRWRVRRGGATVRAMAHADRLHEGPDAAGGTSRGSTRPERARTAPGKPGLYRFFLAHTWSTSLIPDGQYELDVEASGLRGNKGGLALPFVIANNV